MYEGSSFSKSLPTLVIVYLFYSRHPSVKWYLIVVLISISLMTYDVEHLFVCFSDICTSLEKYQFNYFAYLLIGLLLFFTVEM